MNLVFVFNNLTNVKAVNSYALYMTSEYITAGWVLGVISGFSYSWPNLNSFVTYNNIWYDEFITIYQIFHIITY